MRRSAVLIHANDGWWLCCLGLHQHFSWDFYRYYENCLRWYCWQTRVARGEPK
jgi:hypothetical protein